MSDIKIFDIQFNWMCLRILAAKFFVFLSAWKVRPSNFIFGGLTLKILPYLSIYNPISIVNPPAHPTPSLQKFNFHSQNPLSFLPIRTYPSRLLFIWQQSWVFNLQCLYYT